MFHTVARLRGDGDETILELSVGYDAHVPYFWWIFNGLIARSVHDALRDFARAVEAVVHEQAPPTEAKAPWWAPPTSMNTHQVTIVATISFILAVVEYGGSLVTQTVDYVATTFDASNAQIGVVTAVTRVGTLIALVGGALADRVGRRRLLLWSVALVCVSTVLSAAAPNLLTFGFAQVIVRGSVNLAFAIAFIAAVEEAPEGSRTYTIAIVGIASGLGFVLGALLLPLADIHAQAWRGLYALGGVGLFFLPNISRRLTETKRYEALVARNAPRGRFSEVVDRTYGRRFALLCVAGFLLNLFLAPESQFTNRYLSDERGFSGLGILILRACTQAIPALAAAYIGGRLAESAGRRRVATQGLLLGSFGIAAFFLTGGPVLWLMLALGTIGQSISGPALSAFGTELFPTEVRGTAGAGLTVTSVLGSAAGLLIVGYLAEPLGSVGRALALTAIAPVIVAVFMIKRLPEAKGLLLDDVSPSEV